MRKTFMASGFAALILAVSVSACVPSTQEKTTMDSTLGWRCNTPAKGSNIVGGFFRAWHNTSTQNIVNHSAHAEQYRCFKTIEDCQAWLKKLTQANEYRKPEAQFCKQF